MLTTCVGIVLTVFGVGLALSAYADQWRSDIDLPGAEEAKERAVRWLLSVGIPLACVPYWWWVGVTAVAAYLVAGVNKLGEFPRRRELAYIDQIVLVLGWPLLRLVPVQDLD